MIIICTLRKLIKLQLIDCVCSVAQFHLSISIANVVMLLQNLSCFTHQSSFARSSRCVTIVSYVSHGSTTGTLHYNPECRIVKQYKQCRFDNNTRQQQQMKKKNQNKKSPSADAIKSMCTIYAWMLHDIRLPVYRHVATPQDLKTKHKPKIPNEQMHTHKKSTRNNLTQNTQFDNRKPNRRVKKKLCYVVQTNSTHRMQIRLGPNSIQSSG